MIVKIKLMGALREKTPESGQLEMTDGATINDILGSLEIAAPQMKTLPEQIVEMLDGSPGLTHREITNLLRSSSHSPISASARSLAKRGFVLRGRRNDGLIANVLTGKPFLWP